MRQTTRVPLSLTDVVQSSDVRSLAIVGTAKNVGKTVTMNYLASELSARGLTVGLISSGRDGETVDSFTGEPKPSVVPPEGAWVATAEGTLTNVAGALEIVDVLEKPGLLGRLVLGRVIEPSPIELVGPGSARELGFIVGRLLQLGSDLVLVDGALDRIAAASPDVTEGLILVAGDSAHDSLTAIAQQARDLAWLWQRQAPPSEEARQLARQAIEDGYVAFLDEDRLLGERRRYKLRTTRAKTVLGLEEDILSDSGYAAFVVVPGAVTPKFLSLSASWPEREDFAVIAKDPASIFAKGDPGVPLYVQNPANLLAVTVNPVSHRGVQQDPRQLVLSVHRAVSQATGKAIPVFDVVSGESSEKGVSGVALG